MPDLEFETEIIGHINGSTNLFTVVITSTSAFVVYSYSNPSLIQAYAEITSQQREQCICEKQLNTKVLYFLHKH
jgi:hypothetical protein